MWVKREDYERLISQAAQSELLAQSLARADARAESAEKALAKERDAKDWLTLQWSSRIVTKHGGYALTQEPLSNEPPPSHPKGFTHDPTEIDLAKLEYYKQCAKTAGRDESDAVQKWEAEMRGEGLTIEYEAEQ